MARVVNHVGPDLTESIDQPESLTAWRLRYTTAHVRSLQSLAPLISYSFHTRCYHENKCDPIVLFDGGRAAEEPEIHGSPSILAPDNNHCVGPCGLATPSICLLRSRQFSAVQWIYQSGIPLENKCRLTVPLATLLYRNWASDGANLFNQAT